MTRKAFSIWWRVIPANVAAAGFNLLFSITIPLGLWRWSYDSIELWQFIVALLVADGIVWLGVFSYFTRHPIEI